MWNYSFIIPSVLILLIILCYYFLRPRLPIRMNRTFLRILLIDLLTMSVDVISSRLDERYATTPAWLLWAANMLYFLLYFARIYSYYMFSLEVLDQHEEISTRLRQVSLLPFLLCELIVLSSPLTGLIFKIDGSGYHSGPWYNLLYLFSFVYVAGTYVLVYFLGKRLSRFDRLSLLGYNTVLLVGLLARFLMPTYLILNTFCNLAVFVIFISFQNQERYLFSRFTAYNAEAFRTILHEWHGRQNYRMLTFSILNYSGLHDIFGVERMDLCLEQILQLIRRTRSRGLTFYLGSGRFAAIQPDSQADETLPTDLINRLHQPWQIGNEQVHLETAFVLSNSPLAEYTGDKVYEALMTALSDTLLLDQNHPWELREVMEERDRIQVVRQHLLAALADNTAVVCLQPIVRTETGEPVGAEALTRLPDGQGGLLPPSAFISLAEREGKIGLLGDQVLHKVCRFLRDHHAELPWLKWINVNLSPVQCLQDNLADSLHAILQQYGISPEMIHLEITEETMIDSSKFAKQLQALQKYGFQFSLDDYGSGYSNLYRLIEYPFRNIKLDLSIVRSYMEQSNQLLPEVIRAFRAQHFEITAEGVEDKETVQAIKDLGCEYMQGFYFSRPISMDQFLSKYAKRG